MAPERINFRVRGFSINPSASRKASPSSNEVSLINYHSARKSQSGAVDRHSLIPPHHSASNPSSTFESKPRSRLLRLTSPILIAHPGTAFHLGTALVRRPPVRGYSGRPGVRGTSKRGKALRRSITAAFRRERSRT